MENRELLTIQPPHCLRLKTNADWLHLVTGDYREYLGAHRLGTLLSWAAAARPVGPLPMTATFLPVRVRGGSGLIQPISKAWSMMAHSMFLMVTGGELMPRTQAPYNNQNNTTIQ